MAQLRALTPESPLREWVEFTGRPELRPQALKEFANRPADAEEIFRTGLDDLSIDLPQDGPADDP